MDKMIKALKDVPPVPEGICDAVLEHSRSRIHYFMPYGVAALLLLSVSLFLYSSREPAQIAYEEVEESLAYSDDLVYDLFYAGYDDPLDDL